MPLLPSFKSKARAAVAMAMERARHRLDRTANGVAVLAGTVGASLSGLNNLVVDPQRITRIQSAVTNHGVTASDLLAKLPGELEHYGTAAVDAFLNGGNSLGKHWSHWQSKRNASQLSAEAANGLWEDGSINIARGARNMSWVERIRASADFCISCGPAALSPPEPCLFRCSWLWL